MAGLIESFGLSGFYNAGRDLVGWLTKRRNQSNRLQLERQQKWKPIVQEHLARLHHEKLSQRIIVRDFKRIKEYPEVVDTSGISPWFRLEIVSTYYRVIEVALNIHSIIWEESENSWRIATPEERGDSINGWLIGYIPWEYIELIDLDGDEYYSDPNFYCRFASGGQPYEKIAFCERRESNGWYYYTELDSKEAVKRTSEKFDTAKYAWKSPYRD